MKTHPKLRSTCLFAAIALFTSLACAQSQSRSSAPASAASAPSLSSLDWNFGGRVQVDHSSFDGVYSADGSRQSATYLRRATATGSVRWHSHWRFAAAIELDADYKLELDTYALSWRPRKEFELRLGRIDPDFGMEQSGSGNWTFGVERSAIWDLAPDVADSEGGIGVRADVRGEGWQASGGLYDKRGYTAAVGRAVFMPMNKGRNRLHLGASLARAQGFEDDGRIRTRLGVRGVTEDSAGRRSTLGTAAVLPATYDGDLAFGLEAAWQVGPLMLQAEGLQRRLAGNNGQTDRTAQGAYVLAAWSITGEPRRYDEARGRFGSAKPSNERWGAWEVFYRLDGLDVDDGRSATVHTAGIGWTAASTWRAMLNVHSARSGDANRVGDRNGFGMSARLQALF